jgi:LysM repeat protein
MVRRSPARYLAPIALAATIAGTYLIVHASLNYKKAPVTQTASSPITHAPAKFANARTYTVQPNDTLSQIAHATGVPLATLEALNKNVNPGSLQPGQKLRLRR